MNEVTPTTTDAAGINRPNVFIVGVMKGGTSALHDFLCIHPKVHSGKQKEIHFFSLYEANGPDWYHEKFEHNPPGEMYVDASPSYFDIMSGATIASKINIYNPDARVIVMVRNPIERALSHFHHLRKVNKIAELQDMTPDEFFSRDIERALSGTRPTDLYLMYTINFSFYFRKAQAYRRIFGPRFMAIENSSLSLQPQETMARAFRHIGVDPIRHPKFEQKVFSHKSTSLDQLSMKTLGKLTKIFSEDYHAFCKAFGIKPNWVFRI